MAYNYGSNYLSGPYYNAGTNQIYGGYSAQNYNTPYQPPHMQQPVQTQQQISTNPGFVWVQGEAGAKAYPVAAGNSVLLMDSENPVLYMKSTDQSGRPLPIEVYDLVKRQDNPPQQRIPQPVIQQQIDLSGYVKLSDLDSLLEPRVQAMVNKALGGE